MLSLAQYLARERIGKSEFARRLSDKLDERIPPQTVHRWCLDRAHPDYSVPERHRVEGINELTAGAVEPNSWYESGRRGRRGRSAAINIAAARKGAAVRRRRAEARA